MSHLRSTLNLSHSTESPFYTSLSNGERSHLEIYTAKQIADFILSITDLSPRDTDTDEEKLHRDQMLDEAQSLARNHGLLEYWQIQDDARNFDEIYSSGCVLTIAHFYNVLPDLKKEEIPQIYEKCVRAINSLTYFLRTPTDRPSRLPGPVKLSTGERFKLDRIWDISVCLLGAIKAFCGFEFGIRVGDIPIVHDVHYERACEKAYDRIYFGKDKRICLKALKLLTREEVEPFVQPYRLYMEFKNSPKVGSSDDHFKHKKCTDDMCYYDAIDYKDSWSESYHVPGCSKSCGKTMPSSDSLRDFDIIVMQDMPAIKASCKDALEWVEASRKTLVVSHVWRDGIQGTRDDGINTCVHLLLAKIAEDQGCDSYWVDCAVIPGCKELREKMIERINWTFLQAGVVLCWDKGLATLGSDIPETLLSIIVSPWHRRAWTLLEGNRAPLGSINFLRWTYQTDKPYELFNLKSAVKSVFNVKSTVPLWIRSMLVELLPYSAAPLPMDAAGLLLSGRIASKGGDAEVVWNLLRPIEAIGRTTSFTHNDPYLYSDKQVDVAFISSNAERFKYERGTLCWRPGKTGADVWVRTAYGGIKAQIVNGEHETKHLKGRWWAKEGNECKKAIDWNKCDGFDWCQYHSGFVGFALICPILMGDPVEVTVGKHSGKPMDGFFRTSIVMECKRAILITHDQKDKPWQWRGLVTMKDGEGLLFRPDEIREFVIGGSRLH